jgi:CRP-like cAMP-binding protein
MVSQPTLSDDTAGKDPSERIKKLTAEIQRTVQTGDFQGAERLRDALIETYPMAISEAIQAAELIEQAMSAAIDKDHLAIWSDLYDPLSVEERNCLFHSMKKYVLPEKKMLLKYGSLNNRLFFIEKGRVTVAVPQGESKYKVLAQLGQGDVLGEYTFSTMALCSATAVTKTEVELRCLEGQIAETWGEKHPGLYNKILDFCKRYGRVDLISESKERESHTHPRYSVQGRVKAILLDRQGQKTGVVFNGELEEISRSGTSISIHCNQKETVKQLLTRSFSLDFNIGTTRQEISFSSIGRVVRVSFLLYNDYLLHIGFEATLPEELDAQLAP